MKSVFTADKSSNITPEAGRERSAQVPETFSECAGKVLQAVRKELGPNEVRALAADKVASPLLQVYVDLSLDLVLHFNTPFVAFAGARGRERLGG